MTERKSIETMLNTENKNEAMEVLEFLEKLNMEEKREFLAFVQGVKFAKEAATSGTKTA